MVGTSARAPLGDIGCHYFDPVLRALNLGPATSVEATSTRVNNETYPLGAMITYRFPARDKMPPVELVWYDGGLRPPRPSFIKDGDVMRDNGVMLVGDDGVLLTDWDNGWQMFPEERAKEYGSPPKVLARSPGPPRRMVASLQGWSTCRVELRLGRSLDGDGLVGKPCPATAVKGRAYAEKVALGFDNNELHEPRTGEPVFETRISKRLASVTTTLKL